MITKNFIIALLILLHVGLQAQDKKAAKILDKISASYDEATSITLNFDVTIKYPDEEPLLYPSTVIEADGKWIFRNKEQEIYQDGSDIWVYIPSQNEVQINDYDPEEADDYFVSPINILKQYKEGGHKYQISHKDKQKTSIELVPKDEFSDYAKIRITTDNKTSEINAVEVFSKDGTLVSVEIKDLKTDLSYPSDFFDFDASRYPDLIVEDLRLDN